MKTEKLNKLIKIQKEAFKAHKESPNQRSTIAMSVGLGKSKLAIDCIEDLLNTNPDAHIVFSADRNLYLDNFKLELKKFKKLAFLNNMTMCCTPSLKKIDTPVDLFIYDECHKSSELAASFAKDKIEENPDMEMLCLSGTPGNLGSNPLLRICPIRYSYLTQSSITNKILNDYTIYVVKHKLLDNKGSARNTKFPNSELDQYNYLKSMYDLEQAEKKNKREKIGKELTELYKLKVKTKDPVTIQSINKEIKKREEWIRKSRKISFNLIKLKRFFNNLQSKEIAIKLLSNKIKPEFKALIYCGAIAQTKNFSYPSYHSKLSKEKRAENYEKFYNGKINRLTNVNGIKESVSIPDLKYGIISKVDASHKSFEQIIGRFLRLSPDNEAVILVCIAEDSIEEEWFKSASINIPKEKIKYYKI